MTTSPGFTIPGFTMCRLCLLCFLGASLSNVDVLGQQAAEVVVQPLPVPVDSIPASDSVDSDPTRLSPEMQKTLSQIRQLDELREENSRLAASLKELQSRTDQQLANERAERERLAVRLRELESNLNQQLADVEVQGINLGRDGSAAALLRVGQKVRLVRKGSELMLPASGRSGEAQRVVVEEIDVNSVKLLSTSTGEIVSVQ